MKTKFVRKDGILVVADVHQSKVHEFNDLSAIDMLLEVRKLLHGKWTQGSNALNSQGLPVAPTHPHARNFCLRGGCIHVLNPTASMLATDLHVETSYISHKISSALGFKSNAYLVQWNDTQGRTEKEVIELINTRLKVLRKEEKSGKLFEVN